MAPKKEKDAAKMKPLVLAVTLAAGAAHAISNICLTNTADVAYTLANAHLFTDGSTTKVFQQSDAFLSKGGTLRIAFAAPSASTLGLEEFQRTSSSIYLDDPLYFASANWGTWNGTQTGPRYAYERLTSGITDGQTAILYSGSWYVPADATYSFFCCLRRTCRLVIDGRLILSPDLFSSQCAQDIGLKEGWHSFDLVVGPPANANGVVWLGPQRTDVPGLLYSPANAAMSVDDFSAGHEFMAQDNGHMLSTANAATIIPRVAVQGGNAVIDCSNCTGGLRIMGNLMRKSGSVGKIIVTNLISGSTIRIGNTCINYSYPKEATHIDWANVVFPAGMKYVFEGFATVESSFPDNVDYEIGDLPTSLVVRKKDFFGTYEDIGADFHYPNGLEKLAVLAPGVIDPRCTIHVASGQQFRFFGGRFYSDSLHSPKENEGTVSWQSVNTWAQHAISNNLVVDGSIYLSEPYGRAPRFYGNVTGSGYFYQGGWSGHIGFYGDELLLGGTSQLNSRDTTVHVGAKHAYLGRLDMQASAAAGYNATRLNYCVNPLVTPDATPLRIGTLYMSVAPAPHPEWGGKFWRQGAVVQVYSNNTICVGKMIGSGGWLWGDRARFSSCYDWENAEGNFGPGNMVVGSIENAMTLYVATNINLTVTNMTHAVTFKYDAMSNSVNHAKLDVKGRMVAGSSVTATDLYMLPSRIGGFTNGTFRLTGAASLNEGRTYDIELDLDEGPDGLYNLNGCDGSGTLTAAPATGTLNVTFKGANRPAKGRYAIFGCSAGGNLLDGWTVNLAKRVHKGMAFELKRDETGIWLNATSTGATVIIR